MNLGAVLRVKSLWVSLSCGTLPSKGWQHKSKLRGGLLYTLCTEGQSRAAGDGEKAESIKQMHQGRF